MDKAKAGRAALWIGGTAAVVTGVLLATRKAGAQEEPPPVVPGYYTLKLKNPPAVDGFWQCFICDASYPNTGFKYVQFALDSQGQIPMTATAQSEKIPDGWQSPGKLVIWVFQWNSAHTAVNQIGGREALSQDMSSSVTIYDPGFVIPPGSYEVDYLTGEITGVES